MSAEVLHLKKMALIFPNTQIAELKQISSDLEIAEEGGLTYIRIPGLKLPAGCIPSVCDVLLCPEPRDSYMSRLFFPVQIAGCAERNWNAQLRILGQNWHAFSWAAPEKMRLAETLIFHLNGLRA